MDIKKLLYPAVFQVVFIAVLSSTGVLVVIYFILDRELDTALGIFIIPIR